MIGYLVEQELMNALPGEARCATLLTQVEVDDDDPAFVEPTKPIGPVYTQAEAAQALSEHGWTIIEESPGNWRRVVPSPRSEERRVGKGGVSTGRSRWSTY